MARRKRAVKRAAPRRRRRVSGIGAGSPIMSMLMTAGGVLGANMAAKFLPDTLDDKIKAGILTVAGYAIPTYLMKGPTGTAIGMGFGATGIYKLAQSMGLMAGIGMGGTPMIAGYRNSRRQLGMGSATPMVAGTVPQGSTMNKWGLMVS